MTSHADGDDDPSPCTQGLGRPAGYPPRCTAQIPGITGLALLARRGHMVVCRPSASGRQPLRQGYVLAGAEPAHRGFTQLRKGHFAESWLSIVDYQLTSQELERPSTVNASRLTWTVTGKTRLSNELTVARLGSHERCLPWCHSRRSMCGESRPRSDGHQRRRAEQLRGAVRRSDGVGADRQRLIGGRSAIT